MDKIETFERYAYVVWITGYKDTTTMTVKAFSSFDARRSFANANNVDLLTVCARRVP